MPCHVSEAEENAYGLLSKGQLKAVLCGVLSVTGSVVLDDVDWNEVGVSQDLVRKWWSDHQAEDERRRRAEAEAAARKEAV